MLRIVPERLLSDLRTLRSIGAQGIGVVRPAFSVKGMEARRWLAAKYEKAGLGATIDGVGNVPGRSRKPGRALLIRIMTINLVGDQLRDVLNPRLER